MRLPHSSRNNWTTFKVVQYGPDLDAPGPSTWMAHLDDKQPRVLRIRTTFRPNFIEEAEDQSNGIISILIPRSWSRGTKCRGWKRLQIVGNADVDAWLICPRSRIDDSTPSILIHPKLDSSRFMAHLPDSTPWQDLAICGTHDSSALYGFPYAQCQQRASGITQQLHDGVRFLDLRMRVIEDDLIMYHGVQNERAHFTTVLSEIHAFLSRHPSESILVSIKEEVPPIVPQFGELVWNALAPHVDQYWFLETKLPTLGEVRGRAMIMPRFPIDIRPGVWDKGVGLKIEGWPDDRPEGFEVRCGVESINVQDWYGVPSILRIAEKLEATTHRLEPTITSTSLHYPNQSAKKDISITPRVTSADAAHRPLTISYLSAATFMAPPNVLAKGIGWPSIGLGVQGLNDRFTLWLLELMCDGKRIRGIAPVDFYSEVGEVAKLLVIMNQLGYSDLRKGQVGDARVSGETLVDIGDRL